MTTPMTALQAALNAAGPVQSSAGNSRPAAPALAATPVSAKTWLAVAGATLGAFMAVLNIQIVNASLADIQRARSAPASTTAAGFRPRT